MKIKCMLCDRVDHLDENEFIAKRIRNNPLTSYFMCHLRRKNSRENESKAKE